MMPPLLPWPARAQPTHPRGPAVPGGPQDARRWLKKCVADIQQPGVRRDEQDDSADGLAGWEFERKECEEAVFSEHSDDVDDVDGIDDSTDERPPDDKQREPAECFLAEWTVLPVSGAGRTPWPDDPVPTLTATSTKLTRTDRGCRGDSSDKFPRARQRPRRRCGNTSQVSAAV